MLGVTPLRHEELGVLVGTHRTKPVGLQGGKVGQDKHKQKNCSVKITELPVWCPVKLSSLCFRRFPFATLSSNKKNHQTVLFYASDLEDFFFFFFFFMLDSHTGNPLFLAI